MADLDSNRLTDTIPKFHHIGFRLENLLKAISNDPVDRVKLVQDEIKYVRSSFNLMNTIQELGDKGKIPKRVVHNDTKVNNVLFDQDDKGLCVIDLDTVMPGFAHYDFGDGIRTCANTADEDEQDLEQDRIRSWDV